MPGPCCRPAGSHSNPHCLGHPRHPDGEEDRPWHTLGLSHIHQLKDQGVEALESTEACLKEVEGYFNMYVKSQHYMSIREDKVRLSRAIRNSYR